MTESNTTYCSPNFFRYLALMVYDTLLLLSVLLLASAIAVLINSGEAFEQGNPLFTLYLLLVSFLFYGWFWTHGGQTLGMRTWKVTLLTVHSTPITWKQAFIRFSIALLSWLPLGLGFWWQFLSKRKKSWPDSASKTFLHYDKHKKPPPLSRLS